MNIYQRQEELKGWNQSIISNLTCLVLGVGGLGTNISMDLCRLGVKKIHLLDYDTVEAHNLNRQILFSKEHVGKYKVDSAKETLLKFHCNSLENVNPEILTYNINALTNWSKIMELIKDSDIVYNTIDVGDYFDVAISYACQKFSKLMILGGTEPFYGHTISYFMQGIRSEKDYTFLDCHDLSDKAMIEKIKKHVFSEKIEDDISYIPKDSHPVVGGSTVYSAGTCSDLMVAATVNYLLAMNDKKQERLFPKHMFIMNLMEMSTVGW